MYSETVCSRQVFRCALSARRRKRTVFRLILRRVRISICSVEWWDDSWLLNLKSFGRIQALPQHLTGETDRNPGFLARIRTEHFPNTSLERYRCTSLLWVVSWDKLSASKCVPPSLRIVSEIPFRKTWLPYSHRTAVSMQAYRWRNAHRVLVKTAFGKMIDL
jgi:hypothetical protein